MNICQTIAAIAVIFGTAGCSAMLTDDDKRRIVEEGAAAAESHYAKTKWATCMSQTSGQMLRMQSDDPDEYSRWEAYCL